jgi:hypothetical protein
MSTPPTEPLSETDAQRLLAAIDEYDADDNRYDEVSKGVVHPRRLTEPSPPRPDRGRYRNAGAESAHRACTPGHGGVRSPLRGCTNGSQATGRPPTRARTTTP